MTTDLLTPEKHCCCNGGGGGKTLLTLPVAPRPFSRIRFDQLDLPVRAVPAAGALTWLKENFQQGAPISMVDLDGPGDPLAAIDTTMEILDLIRRQYPELQLSLTTLGLHGEESARSLAEAGVTRVTLLVDAVEGEVADKLYAWIRPGHKTIPLSQSIPMLMAEQNRAARAFREQGIAVGIRTTVYPGFNDDHVAEISRAMAECGAESMKLVPCTGGADKEGPMLNPPGPLTMLQLAESAARYLPTSVLPEKEPSLSTDCSSLLGMCKSPANLQLKATKARPNIGVVSMSGMDVDLHLGQAYQVLIYGPREDGLTCLLGTRPVPEPGSGSGRWQELAETLHDCFAILAASAGDSPRRILGEQGITVLITDGEIEGTIDQLYGGGKKRKKC